MQKIATFLLNTLDTAAGDPVAMLLAILLAVVSFFLVQFYYQVQKLITTVQEIEVQNAEMLLRLGHVEKENETLKNKHHA